MKKRMVDLSTAWFGIVFIGFMPGFCAGYALMMHREYKANAILSETAQALKISVESENHANKVLCKYAARSLGLPFKR